MDPLFGGEAEKLGNYYEDNVLIYYYGQVIDGNYLSVMSESFNRDLEQGGDIYLYDNRNNVTVVQAKSSNGNNDAWSISVLISEDIIKNACHHIIQGRKFILTSPLSCAMLQRLVEHANAFNNYEDFFQAVKTNKNAKDLVRLEEEIKKYFNDKDLILFYQNFSLQRFDDDLEKFVILFQNSIRAVGGGREAFQLLRHYAIRNKKLSQKIYADELWRYLTENGVKKYEIDESSAAKRVIDLCIEYKENIKRRLIKNEVYPRKEFDALKKRISDNDVVIVHGKAGTGKSGIILQLCNYFDENNILYLPIGLDAHLPEVSTYQFGRQLSLTASPVDVLSKLANERQAYLIIDQLDAIRWTVSHSTSAFEVCCKLVKEVLAKANVKLVFVCRTIDAEKVLRFWGYNPPKLTDCAVEIKALSDDDVKRIVSIPRYNALTLKVKDMLTNINILSMFLALPVKTTIEKSSDIIREYINEKLSDIVKHGYQEDLLRKIINYLVTNMHANSTQSVSSIDFENVYGREILEQLISSGLIEKTECKIKFSHQSILDYYFAQQLEKEIANAKNIINPIKKYNLTAIKDYEILKQFFEFAEANNPNYVKLIDKILFSSKISSFIRHIALESFRVTSRVDSETTSLVLKILTNKKYGKKYLYYLVYGNYAFTKAFIKSDVFLRLKQSTDHGDCMWVIELLLFATNCNEKYLPQLKDYAITIKDNKDVLTKLYYWIDDKKSSGALFDFKLELLRILNFPNTHIHWDGILSLFPDRAGSYITLILANEIEHEYRFDWHEHMDSIENIVKRDPLHYHEMAMKFLMAHCENFELDGYDNFKYNYTKNLAKCVLAAALKFESSDIIIDFLQSPHILFNNLALETISQYGTDKANILIQWIIDNNYIASLNFHRHRRQLGLLKSIIENNADKLSDVYRGKLITQIKEYKSPDIVKFAKERFEQRKDGDFYSFCEEEQRVLLCAIPQEFLDNESKTYRSYLLRKFPELECYKRLSDASIGEVRNVVSGIGDKCLNFSYKTWRQILVNPKTGRRGRFCEEIDSAGNFVEYGRDAFERAISMTASLKQQMFVELALNVRNIPHDFINAICSGLGESAISVQQRYHATLSADICDEELRLKVFQKYFDITDKNFLASFISFVENTKLMNVWIEQKLIEIAINPDKYENAEMNVCSPRWDNNLETLSTYDLETEKINRVQTRAIAILADMLFETKHITPIIQEILDECCNAAHPVLLFSAVDIIYPIWNFDRQFVVDYLVKILLKDIRVIRGRTLIPILDRVVSQNSEAPYLLIKSAIDKGGEYLSEIGKRVVYYYCYYNIYNDIVKTIVNLKPDIVLEVCLEIINGPSESEKNNRAKRLLLSINEKTLDANYYPQLTDVLFDNDNKRFSGKLLRKLKSLPNHEWYVLLSDLNERPALANVSYVVFALADIIICSNKLNSYEVQEFIGILVRLFSELYDKKDRKGWRLCLKKINLIYDHYVMDTLNVIAKIN